MILRPQSLSEPAASAKHEASRSRRCFLSTRIRRTLSILSRSEAVASDSPDHVCDLESLTDGAGACLVHGAQASKHACH